MAAALVFDKVSKQYRGAREYRALRDDLTAALRLTRGRRPPTRAFNALDDVSFEIREGESTAIIGENGAGKTTSLKLATRIAYPTSGSIRVRGRVGALIEVGTGMHPELSGRENVDLYGRILGLTKRDVDRRFEEIVEFAGIGRAIDQPVKQYSSGMQLRLGFSVAAHLEPDVLLVDEAIAVGDAGFQYRCVERMQALVREGRTLVFVSHDMSAVETLCDRAILLASGKLVDDGSARAVVARYLESFAEMNTAATARSIEGTDLSHQPLEVTAATLHDDEGTAIDRISTGDPLTIRLSYRAKEEISRPQFAIGITDGRAGALTVASMAADGGGPARICGPGTIECRFQALPLRPRTYEVWCSVRHASGHGDILDWQLLRRFRVAASEAASGPVVTHAPVLVPYSWRLDDA